MGRLAISSIPVLTASRRHAHRSSQANCRQRRKRIAWPTTRARRPIKSGERTILTIRQRPSPPIIPSVNGDGAGPNRSREALTDKEPV
jgi:hypothetical protein